jgi:hypothetical protein
MTTEINKGSRGTLILLIISTIVFGLMIIPGVWIAAWSVMLFDAPDSTGNVFLITFFTSIVSFPVMCLFSFSAWIFYFFRKYKISAIVSLLPLVSVVLVIVLFTISSVFFDGNFAP